MSASSRPSLVFVCGHLCDERLYAAQVAKFSATHDCRVFVFRDHDSLGAMAEELLEKAPPRFALVGLSMGGYVAFEVLRRAVSRLQGLALLDTSAAADTPQRRAGRAADIDKVKSHGIESFSHELPARWLAPVNARDPACVKLVREMAIGIGPEVQRRQQAAIAARPDSLADLALIEVPTLVACGREDAVTPVEGHEEIAARIPGSRLAVIENSGHLSTIEQPDAVNEILARWIAEIE